MDTVTSAALEAASARLEGVAHHTPIATSRTLDARTGARVLLKCENVQRAGAFKFRGAYNALSELLERGPVAGVLTYSSGNHAQALALAGQLLDVPVVVVMPSDAPAIKRIATEGYGAEVVLYDRSTTVREVLGAQIAEARGLPLIPPYDDVRIVAGQSTAAAELFMDAGPLDWLLVPCGGGGLLSGSALAARMLAPGCRVVGVEPARADDAMRSFRSGVLQTVHNPDTIADGARTPSLGRITFPIIQRHVHDIVTVEEDAILEAVRFCFERMKLVVEPTGALGVAALLSGAFRPAGGRVGVILSGGNLDPALLCGQG